MAFIVVPQIIGFGMLFYWLASDAMEKRRSKLSKMQHDHRGERQ